jgi:hypothetical protein
MPMIWEDGQVGRFVFDEECQRWETRVRSQTFNVFSYHWGKKQTDKGYESPDGWYELAIEDRNGTIDRPAVINLALKVLSNQAALVEAVTNAIWEDLNGRGPESTMWWHGDLSFPECDVTGLKHSWIVDRLSEAELSLNCSDGLLKLMRLQEMVIRDDVRGYKGPLVEFRFDAAFEMEHGVGVLSDGDRILGTGYQIDVDLFQKSSAGNEQTSG